MPGKKKKMGRPRKENPEPIVRITMQFPLDIHANLKKEAENEQRSMVQQAIYILRKYFEEKKK